MTTSSDLMDMTIAAIGTETDAGDQVFRPGDWPTQSDQYPRLKLRAVREFKQSLGRSGPPQFIVTLTLRIIGEVSEPVQVDDAGAAAAEVALWRLKGQVEAAIINSYPLFSAIQQIASIDAQLSYNSDAETHLAGIQIDVGMEFYQGAEDFASIASEPLEQVHAEVTNHQPVGFTTDLPQ